jgi:sodium transport system permease protein
VNVRNVRLVFAKELRETLRDRRTLLIMLVVPVFLYPALLVVIEQLAIFGQRHLEEAPVTVVVQGASPEALTILRADPSIRLEVVEPADAGAVARGERDALLDFGSGPADGSRSVIVVYDASRDRSRRARDLALDRLNEWGDSLLTRRLVEHGLPASFVQPVLIADSSVATAERMGGYTLGRFLPMLLILMTLLGAFYPAIDLSAGEKERGTLETLLTTPVPPREIVAGKFLTVSVIALGAATLNLASMLLTFQFAALQFARAMDVPFSLPWSTILLVLAFLVPLAIFFAAIFLGMALRAQSFKEAQNTLTPVQLASMVPMMLPLIPGIPLSYAVAVVPIGGVALLFRELMAGGAPTGPAMVALGSTVVYAILALWFAASSFGREEVLFGAGTRSGRPESLRERITAWRMGGRPVPTAGEALAFVAVVALLYFYGGVTLQLRVGETGILLSQVLLLALPAVLFAAYGPFRTVSALALRRPSARQILAALLVVLGGMPVGWLLGWLQSLVLPIPEEFLAALEDLIRADTPAEVVWLLVLVALTPAICEELVFRGLLLQGLSSQLTASRAVALSAVIFGAFHLSVETAIRFLPSAWLGVLLGYVVWRTRSTFTGMLMHFVNNGLIVLIFAVPAAEAYLIGGGGEPSWMLVAGGIILLLLGFWILPPRAGGVTEGTPA